MAQAFGQLVGFAFVPVRQWKGSCERECGCVHRGAFYLCRSLRRWSRYPSGMGQSIDPEQLSRLVSRLAELRQEHRDLDAAIARLQRDLQADELLLKRMKKRKLALKDQIAWIENRLIPDEPA